MDTNIMTRLGPENIERNAEGFWLHPALPGIVPGPEFFEARKIETATVYLREEEHYPVPGAAYMRVFGEEANPVPGFWYPRMPEGDGWFLLAIIPTNQGPAAVWGRNVL